MNGYRTTEVVGVIVAAALTLAGLAWRSVRRRPRTTPVPGAAARRQVDLTFAAAVLVTLAVGVAAVLWLLAQANQISLEKDRAAAQADAVKTGATIALGTGGAAYLLLAYRRQRLEEVDTRERRITELYAKAVEELGHDKAPVRLGALYSLERLAQNNPEHRQTVVDVVCAYLRMPYTSPARKRRRSGRRRTRDSPRPDGPTTVTEWLDPDRDQGPLMPGQDLAQEELQVHRTAQRILAAHLRRRWRTSDQVAQRRRPSPREAFWPGISLDLTGATLVDVNFESLSVVEAQFSRATFQGDARFEEAAFQQTAWFDKATFPRGVNFDKATFRGGASFFGATFQQVAWFGEVAFREVAA
jgi:Pentapeptide repeats (9 copies)